MDRDLPIWWIEGDILVGIRQWIETWQSGCKSALMLLSITHLFFDASLDKPLIKGKLKWMDTSKYAA